MYSDEIGHSHRPFPPCFRLSMAELELKQDRLISGTGLVRVPSDIEDPRYLRLCIDIVREVPEPHESYKYTPTRSRYCTCSFMRDGYVIAEETVDYKRRCFDFVSDIAGQTLIAVKCAYKGILETFVNLGNALNLAPFIIANNIEDYEHLNLFWDEVQITCESTTAVQVRLFVLEHDDDCESSDPFRPPPPPPPLPPIPPNTSIGNISRPYPGDDVTQPNPLDELEPPPLFPVGNACQRIRIRGRVLLAPSGIINWEEQFWGPVEDVFFNQPIPTVNGQQWRIVGISRGNAILQPCQPAPAAQYNGVTGGTQAVIGFEITSVTPL